MGDLCQPCERGHHDECEGFMEPCDCGCQSVLGNLRRNFEHYANEAAREQADLRRKERKER